MHISASLHFAGFLSVDGTMWNFAKWILGSTCHTPNLPTMQPAPQLLLAYYRQ